MSRIAIAALLLLAGSGCQQVQKVGDVAGNIYNFITGDTPGKAARNMEDPYFADERREGINYLVVRDFGRRDPYTKRYRQIAKDDRDYLVRAVAVRALNRARDAESTPVFIAALSDENVLVRLEAAKALANLPNPTAVEPLIKVVTNPQEEVDVRIAAADALRHYKSLEAARALIGVLRERSFGVAWQARRSLRTLTGQDLRYDESAWLAYVTGPQKPFG